MCVYTQVPWLGTPTIKIPEKYFNNDISPTSGCHMLLHKTNLVLVNISIIFINIDGIQFDASNINHKFIKFNPLSNFPYMILIFHQNMNNHAPRECDIK